jgi:hypothetical protein
MGNSFQQLLDQLSTSRSSWEAAPDSVAREYSDQIFTHRFRGTIFGACNNKCVRCGSKYFLEMDHCFRAKAKGGKFAFVRGGRYVPNVIVLCRRCNASKGKKSLRSFFTFAELVRVSRALDKIGGALNGTRR